MWYDLAMVSLGTFLVSASVCYACFSVLRVYLLQEELFAIRDALWDKARELNAFDMPEYVRARQHINSCIAVAKLLSVDSVVLYGSKAFNHVMENFIPVAKGAVEKEPMKLAISEAYLKLGIAILFYITVMRASGWLACIRLGHATIELAVRKWVDSRAAEVMRAGEQEFQDIIRETSWLASSPPSSSPHPHR